MHYNSFCFLVLCSKHTRVSIGLIKHLPRKEPYTLQLPFLLQSTFQSSGSDFMEMRSDRYVDRAGCLSIFGRSKLFLPSFKLCSCRTFYFEEGDVLFFLLQKEVHHFGAQARKSNLVSPKGKACTPESCLLPASICETGTQIQLLERLISALPNTTSLILTGRLLTNRDGTSKCHLPPISWRRTFHF